MNEQIFLSLGSNLGNRRKHIADAITAIDTSTSISNLRQAGIFETEPLYNLDQPPFLNTVVAFETSLEPLELLDWINILEQESGRPLVREKNQPRALDIDILSWGKRILEDRQLIIPHFDLHNRRFVLIPWAQIDGEFLVPKLNKTVSELLSACVDSSAVKEHFTESEL